MVAVSVKDDPIIYAPSSCGLPAVDGVGNEAQTWCVEGAGLWVCSCGDEAGLVACKWQGY